MTLGTSVSDDSIYKYSKIQKAILEDVKKTAYSEADVETSEKIWS